MENTVESPYKPLVGTGRTGDFVLESQGGSEGFKNVSQFWFPKTITFEQAIENLEKERSEREDITGLWEDWEFVIVEGKLRLKNKDERVFSATEHALNQAIGWCETTQTHIKQTLDPEFEADETDLQQLVDMLNYRKQRHHRTNKGEERELVFRTYNNDVLRAVLTTDFRAIDNRWFLEVLRDLIPGGRLSHQRGNSDDLFGNILLPDNVRHETDSDYGGMLAIRNSEIGRASVNTRPSLFRAICQNGCIWDEEKGVSYKQVHKGKIDLNVLSVQIGENLDRQIKLIPSVMENFLNLRQFEFKDVVLTSVFAAVADKFKMTTGQVQDVMSEFAQHEKNERTAFGICNAVTRAGQRYDVDTLVKFDQIGGQMISANWESIVSTAKSLSEKEIAKIIGATMEKDKKDKKDK